ncbi:MAG: dethiobiotin synthase [Bacteroidetes bacterium]|nr:dethiobiotin synthase [Bacteroidota bacterium]
MNIAVAGIHTGIGKTVCSAVICQALGFDYWKPVQAGELDNTDSQLVQRLVSNTTCQIHAERFRLKKAASPHDAAAHENISISRDDFQIPSTQNNLLIETAGGLMSPLNTNFLNINLLEHLNLPVVLVSNNYLGSINHTLLSCEAMKHRNLNVLGLVLVGNSVRSSEEFILQHTHLPHLFSIPLFKKLDRATIKEFATPEKIKIPFYD